ncbi:MAG: hypothetical protein Q4P36_05820 [Bowdeniella nasicola]|nr:hypothetical protein [Bowdeniella nasicola]
MTTTLNRRTLVKGAAWAVPSIAVASAAPAVCASNPVTTTGTICKLHYGEGTRNEQTHSVTLGIDADQEIIPAGTVYTWAFTMSGGEPTHNEVPEPEYSPSQSWTLSVSPAPSTVTSKFTATLRMDKDVRASDIACLIRLVWKKNHHTLSPTAQIDIEARAQGEYVSSQPYSLSYTTAKRHPSSVNKPGREPHHYRGVNGRRPDGQPYCYPKIVWTTVITRTGYDNMTCWPGLPCAEPDTTNGHPDADRVTSSRCP